MGIRARSFWALKFTATSQERHYVWLTALSFLSHSPLSVNELTAVPPPPPPPKYDVLKPPPPSLAGSPIQISSCNTPPSSSERVSEIAMIASNSHVRDDFSAGDRDASLSSRNLDDSSEQTNTLETPLSSVSTIQSDFHSLSEGEQSFIDGNEDSVIENGEYERSLPSV
jgi:hypothetical protein